MIQAEFGGANPISLSEYYKGGAYVTATDIAPNVPGSGAISLSNFHGAAKNIAGQLQWTTYGTFDFIVPAGVTSIAAVSIGSGGGGARGEAGDTDSSPAGGGGALSYSNAIPVTPGETLTIVVGQGGSAATFRGDGNPGADTGIRRGATTFLLKSQGGRGGNWASAIGGAGGAAATFSIGDVRYSGGKGADATSFTYGGWSGKYTGIGLAGSGSPATNQSATLFGENTGTSIGAGGRGGKSSASPGNAGAVRIMWGFGRAYPSPAADV
jgi:hypothetical protein